MKGRGLRSRIHVRAARGHPLSKAKAAANRAKSRIRARIEHVFGAQETAPGGRIVRTIGIVRARIKIGLQNLAYNMRRLGDARTDGRRMRAHSTVKCNEQIFGVEENLARGLVAEYLSGARVKFILDPLDIGIGQNREV